MISLKKEIAKYSNLLYSRGLVGAAGGNVSARYKDLYLITAGGLSLRDVSENDIIIVDENGNIVEGESDLKPSKETKLHINIYKNRKNIDSVIHVHPPYTTGFSVKKLPIPMITASSRLKLRRVPLVKYANPGSEELAEYVDKCIKTSPEYISAITLECHGLIAFAKGMRNCFDIAELVEETARIAFISKNIG